MIDMMGNWECPGCGETFLMDDGKDKEKIISHLSGHVRSRERVLVVQHEASGQLLGVFEDSESYENWLGPPVGWERYDVDVSDALVKGGDDG